MSAEETSPPSGPSPDPPSGDPKPLPGAVAFLNMGLSAAVCVAAGVFLGLWLDDVFHTAPALLLVGLLLGLVTATYSVIKLIRQYL
ncbi:MAG TPA: AtpZ/AtpI family protein [Acidimicrobiales bacterium]